MTRFPFVPITWAESTQFHVDILQAVGTRRNNDKLFIMYLLVGSFFRPIG
jgi:hypothetical protein